MATGLSKGELLALKSEAETAVTAHRGDGFAEKVVRLVDLMLSPELVPAPVAHAIDIEGPVRNKVWKRGNLSESN